MEQNYSEAFRRAFDRDPTREDVHAVLARLPLGDDATGDFDKALKDMVVDGGLTPDAVNDVIAKMAMDSKAEREAKEAATSRSRRSRRRAILALVGSILLGGALGIGLATYRAITDPATAQLKHSYESKLATMDAEFAARKASLDEQYASRMAALDERFFGPLADLSAPASACSLSKLERQLSVERWLGADHFNVEINDSKYVVMDKTVGGIRVLAKQYPVTTYFKGETGKPMEKTDFFMMVERRLAADDIILGVFVYSNGDAIGSLTPYGSVVFDGSNAKIGNFVTRNICVADGVRTVFSSNNGFQVYFGLATRIADQFRELYGRGPNTDK